LTVRTINHSHKMHFTNFSIAAEEDVSKEEAAVVKSEAED
jgi:hypothetical protein